MSPLRTMIHMRNGWATNLACRVNFFWMHPSSNTFTFTFLCLVVCGCSFLFVFNFIFFLALSHYRMFAPIFVFNIIHGGNSIFCCKSFKVVSRSQFTHVLVIATVLNKQRTLEELKNAKVAEVLIFVCWINQGLDRIGEEEEDKSLSVHFLRRQR